MKAFVSDSINRGYNVHDDGFCWYESIRLTWPALAINLDKNLSTWKRDARSRGKSKLRLRYCLTEWVVVNSSIAMDSLWPITLICFSILSYWMQLYWSKRSPFTFTVKPYFSPKLTFFSLEVGYIPRVSSVLLLAPSRRDKGLRSPRLTNGQVEPIIINGFRVKYQVALSTLLTGSSP